MKLLLVAFFTLFMSPTAYSQTEDTTAFVCLFPPEPQPKFPGGADSLYNFIKANSNWLNDQQTVKGTVFVQFNINEDGSTSDVKIIRGLCESCDKEAIRLINSLPKWTPAIVEGIPQKTQMVYPIKFNL